MKQNFKLTIEYDGSLYCGWQRQKQGRSIQAEIENALGRMMQQNIVLIGSGRTDAGVHALGQAANFICDTQLSAENVQKGLNSMLPEDIVIMGCERVPDDFHARYRAKKKTYRYRILNRTLPSAIGRQYVWHIRRPLDAAAMRRCLPSITGTHDFKSFEGSGSPRSSSIRTVFEAAIHDCGDGMLVFEITADGFLRFMIRNIVGTLVEVGLGRNTEEGFDRILRFRDRNRAGITAPAHGLVLVRVEYD
ncbi:MAG: tRNA pseudouridine(38-40) synthase TruA [Desulfobacteraceae bacterium]|nr:MAG: tRNA pseudouridine(38-40) synthase TruA [Desulfobacteraceae bacterium]